MIITKQAFNSGVLAHFHNTMYRDVLTEDSIISNEIGIKLDDTEKRYPGFLLRNGLTTYFLRSADIDKLPLRVINSYKVIDGKNVYHVIGSKNNGAAFNTVRIPRKNVISFRDLIDWFCNYESSNKTHILLYKICIVSAYVDRVNFRLSTNGGFGKDSVIDALRDLMNNACRIDKATYAKLEYVLKFPIIVCNEVASLKTSELEDFESFGLSAGAFQNKYTKRSRKTLGTKEIYDISKLSLVFTFNNAKSYLDKGEKCFDQIFRKEFLERFLPIKMNGWIDVKQFKHGSDINYEEECKTNLDAYKCIIQKINWLYWVNFGSDKDSVGEEEQRMKDKELVKHNYYYHEEKYVFPKNCGKHKRSFDTICKYIGLYSNSQVEFDFLCSELYNCYNSYLEEEIIEKNCVIEEERVI